MMMIVVITVLNKNTRDYIYCIDCYGLPIDLNGIWLTGQTILNFMKIRKCIFAVK